jgi:hypothetical protein
VRVAAYVRQPGVFQVAVLTEDGLLRHEDGGVYHPDELPEGTRAFGQWDVVRGLMRQGLGEALCWRAEEVKWRRTPRPEEEDWVDRPTDVAVHRVHVHPRRRERAFLADAVAWRDWLRGAGARAASGTVGSEAMSLLRASLQGRAPIVTGRAFQQPSDRPPIRWTRGGRIEDGPGGPGCYRGRLVQLDLPSAYSSLLGSLRYAGAWRQVNVRGAQFDSWLLAGDELPMFVRAQVLVPPLDTPGPLLRHTRHRHNFITMQELALRGPPDPHYPSDCYLAGTWTRAELLAAMRVGCVVEPQQAWVHFSPRQPFRRWWELILGGRDELRGEAGELLVKMTGNALVGQFSREGGRRSIRGGGRRMRRLPPGFQPYPAHDLAEYVTGTTRARLYELIRWAGDRLLTAHTDGAWVVDDGTPYPEGWRVKQAAHQLDYLAPAMYRYWRGRWPSYVYAGSPPIEAEERFSEAWAGHLARAAA